MPFCNNNNNDTRLTYLCISVGEGWGQSAIVIHFKHSNNLIVTYQSESHPDGRQPTVQVDDVVFINLFTKFIEKISFYPVKSKCFMFNHFIQRLNKGKNI